MTATHFPHVFDPLQVNGITLKNRLLSAPMGAHGLSAEGYMTPEAIDFYAQLAKGGVAVVCIGETLVHSATGNDHGRVFRLDDPGTLTGLIQCTDTIHRYQALASVELLHPGRRADPIYNKDHTTYGPTGGFAHYGDGQHEVTELTEEMIATIVAAYGDAAEMAKLGGCDMVTVHGGHGWLLNQFLSPANNQRTDRFGGSIENRCRIYLLVADAIRAKCGPTFPIDFRISGADFMENGATLEDTVVLAQLLAPKIDMLHVSATSFHSRKASIRMFPSTFLPRGCNAYLAEEIKKHVNIPVVTVGAFNDPAQMEELLSQGRVDGIALGRALLADPLLPEKAKNGLEDDILYCVRCNNCMSASFVPYVKYALGISHCAVNPWHGLLTEKLHFPKPYGHQKLLIAGGGPAGMEAALGAAECGHQVILCEQSDSLGGALRYAWHPQFKQDLHRFVEVLSQRIAAADNIELRLNTQVTPDLVRAIAPDALVVAVGAKPRVLAVPGMADSRVINALAIHAPETVLGQKIVIIGGGLIGCEEGIDLVQTQHKEVTILEMGDKLMGDATYVHYLSTLTEMEALAQLKVQMNQTCTGITPQGVVTVDAQGRENLYPADTIIVAVGMEPLGEAAASLDGTAPTVIRVGDCDHPAQMAQAVLSGYFAGYHLQRL